MDLKTISNDVAAGIDWVTSGVGSLAAAGMGLQRLGELAEDFGKEETLFRSLSGLQGLKSRCSVLTTGAVINGLWYSGRAAARCFSTGSHEATTRDWFDLFGGALTLVNLTAFTFFQTSLAFRVVTALAGVGLDAAGFVENVRSGASWRENVVQLCLMIFFNTGREERRLFRTAWDRMIACPHFSVPSSARALAFARHKAPIRGVGGRPRNERKMYRQVERELDALGQRLKNQKKRASGVVLQSIGERARALGAMRSSLDRLRRLGLTAFYDVMEGEPFLRVVLGGENYRWQDGRLLHLETRRTVEVLEPGDSIRTSLRTLNGYAERQHAVYFEGRVFEWAPAPRQFVDEFGNRLDTTIESGRGEGGGTIVVTARTIPSLHCIPDSPFTINYRGKPCEARPLNGGKNLFTIRPEDGNPLLIRFSEREKTLGLMEGIVFSSRSESCFYYDGIKYRVTESVSVGRARLFQGVCEGDRSRSVVFRRDPSGSFAVIKKPVMLEKVGRRREDEILISHNGRTYAAEKHDGELVFAVGLGASEGMADNWLVLKRDQTGIDGKFASYTPLAGEELSAQFSRRLERLSPMTEGGDVGFDKLPRPPKIQFKKTGIESRFQGHPKLKDFTPVSLGEYRVQLNGTHALTLLLPPESGRAWNEQHLERALKRIPLLTLQGIDRITVVPKDATLRLVDGEEIGGFYDYAKSESGGVLVLRDGCEPDPEHLLVHEVMGHGIERNNAEIEELIVLAMKLHPRTNTLYAAIDPGEYFAEAMETFTFYPERRADFPNLYRLAVQLLRVAPQKIANRGARLAPAGRDFLIQFGEIPERSPAVAAL